MRLAPHFHFPTFKFLLSFRLIHFFFLFILSTITYQCKEILASNMAKREGEREREKEREK